jgi:protein ImuB
MVSMSKRASSARVRGVTTMYACLYRPPALDGDSHREARGERGENPGSASAVNSAVALIAREFSPRYECHRDDLVTIDVSGLERLLGPARTIGEELRRDAASRGVRVHVAVAGARIAALILAHARPGVTIVEPGGEAEALAPIAIGILEKIRDVQPQSTPRPQSDRDPKHSACSAISAVQHWGVQTLGELAALPSADLAARLGRQALVWQALARGEDVRPLVPTLDEERFESTIELEWPIEGLEPLSFVLTRLLEPLSTRLERRDRGAAVLHVLLRVIDTGSGRADYVRRLELPTPMRDVRTLRTLALLDLESHPPGAAVDRVTIVIDPTPGRVLQHALFTRAQPTPEQLSTLLARLAALMGPDRLGAPAVVDSYRPGAFAMAPFKTEHQPSGEAHNRGARSDRGENGSGTVLEHSAIAACSAVVAQPSTSSPQPSALSSQPFLSALRRCRQPVPARVAIDNGRPVRVTTDRRGFVGGTVVTCAGPWRTSGEWWNTTENLRSPVLDTPKRADKSWNRDEWDVALNDGAVYRIFQDRETESWYIDAIVD